MTRLLPMLLIFAMLCSATLAANWYDPNDATRPPRHDPAPAGWVRNPDDSAVFERNAKNQITAVLYPPRYRKWVGGALVGMNQAERDAVDATGQRGLRRGIAAALIEVRANLQAATAERAALESEGKTAATLERFDEVVAALQARRDALAARLP